MTLDDLERTYNKAWASSGSHRAGIRAIVVALRDETSFRSCACRFWLDDILGDAGNEKAAGGPTREDGQATLGNSQGPAADPSEVCEWRDDAYIGCFTTSCSDDAAWNRLGGTPKDEGYNFCPSCGKPIAFKEATP